MTESQVGRSGVRRNKKVVGTEGVLGTDKMETYELFGQIRNLSPKKKKLPEPCIFD